MDDAALYLEVDEDITSAIDKLGKTAGKSVSIVVPKRSTMLQSVINLKLLKKAAAEQGKELVLVTGDRIATDLAARVGLAVAPALGAKAVMGEATAPQPSVTEDVIEESDPEPPMVPVPVEKPASKASKVAAPLAATAAFTHRTLGDQPVSDLPSADAVGHGEAFDVADPDGSHSKSDAKSPKIPNFNKMRRRMLWAGGALGVIIAYFVMMAVFASAKVTIYASANKVDVDTTFTADPAASSSTLSANMLTGKTVTFSKDLTGNFTATGQQDAGTKSTGTMTVSNGTGVEQPLVAGTRFAAPDGKIFRSAQDIQVPAAHLNAGGDKVNGTKDVGVVADQNGDSYNEAPAVYSIPALANPKITGQGAQLSGGTSKIITIVSQDDINKAEKALLDADKDSAQKNLYGQVPSGNITLPSSLNQAGDNVVANPPVNQQGSSATITLKVTYTELAVNQADYSALVNQAVQKQIGTTNQIYDNGIKTATVTLTGKSASGVSNFHFITEGFVGAKLDTAQIAKAVKGKRYGDAQDYLGKLPGVVQSQITLWPAWASNLPGRASKITISIQIAGTK